MYYKIDQEKIRSERNIVIDLLKQRINNYRDELLALLDEWHYLKRILQPQLLFKYDSLFGKYEFEVRNRTLMSVELDKRISLYTKTENEKNEMLHSFIQDDENINKGDIKNIVNSGKHELPAIYRKLVKKIHPDVNTNNEYFSSFWYNIQDAYKSGNLDRLRMFHETLCNENQTDDDEGYNKELTLRNEVRKLRMNISSEKRNISRLKNQPPYVFVNELEKQEWIEEKKNEYKEKLLSLEKTIKRKKELLNRISGHDWTSYELFSNLGSLQ